MAEATIANAGLALPDRSAADDKAASRGARRRRKATEFWLYFIATYPIFLIVALVSLLLPKSRRPFPPTGRGVFADAKAAAYTVLPFVFMG